MNEDLKMHEDTYPVSHNAPVRIPMRDDIIRDLCEVLKEDVHEYLKDIETNYEPDLAEAYDKIWKGELVL